MNIKKAIFALAFMVLLTACGSAARQTPTAFTTPPSLTPVTRVVKALAPALTPTAALTLTVTPTLASTFTVFEPTLTISHCLDGQTTVFRRLIEPVWVMVEENRREWQKDPRYLERVEWRLNDCRINFLLFGFGETHEPGMLDWGLIGSQTFVSLNLRTGKIDLISLTHDIWAPELRRKLRPLVSGMDMEIEERISQAYFVGGFPLMKEVLEDATGLSVDLEASFKDSIIRDLVKDLFDNRLPVYIPEDFETYPYWMDKVLYPTGQATDVIKYSRGIVVLDGNQTAGFIKAVPIPRNLKGEYPPSIEHNRRKEMVFEAIKANASIKAESQKLVFLKNVSYFLLTKWWESKSFWLLPKERTLDFDFAPEALVLKMLAGAADGYQRSEGLGFPDFGKKIYLVDGAHGDGGVRWAKEYLWYMEIPIGILNPNGDLVKEYWPSVRAKVKELLLTPLPAGK